MVENKVYFFFHCNIYQMLIMIWNYQKWLIFYVCIKKYFYKKNIYKEIIIFILGLYAAFEK